MSSLYIKVSHRCGDFELDVERRLPERGVTALLGPSGSGKSTVLRMIAGLERPASGYIRHGESVWFDAARRFQLPPQRRRVGLVFQDYALFEHLSVADNVGYGLARGTRAAVVARWLERLHLTAYAQRYPHQLSGGQRQRVALARALAPAPEVLLLDEPFSALDVALRDHLRQELLETVAALQLPVILVTHDLDDARYLADHVGVLVDGHLECFGTTAEVLARPSSAAAARVLGWRNLLPVREIDGTRVAGAWGEVRLEREPSVDTAWVGVRPEHLHLGAPGQGCLQVRVERIIELGAVRSAQCRLGDGTLLEMHRPWDEPLPAPGEAAHLQLAARHLSALPQAAARAVPPVEVAPGEAVVARPDVKVPPRLRERVR